MTNAEKIMSYDIKQMADYLCYLTGSTCENCRFGECEAREECAAIKYLQSEAKEDERWS